MKQKIINFLKIAPLLFLTISICFTFYIVFKGLLIRDPSRTLNSNEIKFIEEFNNNLKAKKVNKILNVLNSKVSDRNELITFFNKKEFKDIPGNLIPKIQFITNEENVNFEEIGLHDGKKIEFLLAREDGKSLLCVLYFGKNIKEYLEIAGFNFKNIELSISEILERDKLKTNNFSASNFLILGYLFIVILIWIIAYIKLIKSSYSSEKKYYFLIFLFVAGITYDWNSSELLTQYQYISLKLSPLDIKKHSYLENWKILVSFPIGAVLLIFKLVLGSHSNSEDGA